MVFNRISPRICASCFAAILEHFKVKVPIENAYSDLEILKNSKVECPLFVTWTETKTDELRGCIGTLSPVPVEQIKYYALSSALCDRRFFPVDVEEIKNLTCSVSFLHDYEKCIDPYDWTIGVHGVYITFKVDGHEYSSTYLPEVALEHNFTKEQTINQLIAKAGYYECEEAFSNMEVQRYKSAKFKLSYDEFLKL